jgi:hypothetical protein
MMQILANTARAEALVALDDAGSAEDAAREAVRRADTTDFVTFRADGLLALGAALESRGAFDEAVLRGHEALGLFEVKQNLPGSRRARAFLGRVNHTQPRLEAN